MIDGPRISIDGDRPLLSSESRGRLRPGQTLDDRFVIVRFIAKGGMGEVYEAEDQKLENVHVALKTILPNLAQNPDLRMRFKREVLIAREVSHLNLCPIYDISPSDQPPLYLTMKLLPGSTLATRLLKRTSVLDDEKLTIARQLAAGILALHDADIIHRDIKPSNVMIDGSGPNLRLWITDFGLARAFEYRTKFDEGGRVVGTPDYMAPELRSGHPASEATDLFAFGIVLHEVFTGERPKVGEDGKALVPSPRLKTSGAPSFCTHLVRECLDLDPQRRCQAFEQALVPFGLKRRQKNRWTRRQFIGTAAAGICSLGGVTWWEWDKIQDILQPIPQKRFVALLNWPRTSDLNVAPMLTGALSAIKSQLARLEVFDRNLFVVSPDDVNKELAGAEHLKEVCDPLGANLVLAASGTPGAKYFELLLRLLDPLGQPLRQKSVRCSHDEIPMLPDKAVQAAATLLNLEPYLHTNRQLDPGTQLVPAYVAYQSAETLILQPNDSGLDAAIVKYKEAIDLDPHYAIAYARLAIAYGRLYALHHDPAALNLARGNCEAALRLNPNLVDGHLALSAVLQDTGNVQSALDEIDKALAVDPSNPLTLIWQGQMYFGLNRWADAENTLNRVVKQRPNNWLAYNELGVVLNMQGKYQAAISAFRTACLAAPNNALAFNNLGALYLQIGNFDEATENFKKSLALNPNGMAAANTSLALRSEGKYAEALPYALKSTALDPGNDANWLELGDCYSSLHRQADAITAYQRAAKETEESLRVNPKNGAAMMSLALYQVKSGDPRQALSLIREAELSGAGDMNSQLTKAQIFEDLGRRDEALDVLAACFRKGATRFEIAPVPDFQRLQKDPRYQEILRINSVTTETDKYPKPETFE